MRTFDTDSPDVWKCWNAKGHTAGAAAARLVAGLTSNEGDIEKAKRPSNTAELMGDPTFDGNTLSSWQPSPLVVTCFAVAIRYMVCLWPYSGQAQQPIYGDYEAQRHWMEITTSLQLHQWYRFDLEYWGLDYPPLTAYVSWVCGKLSATFEPASMVLGLSRGYETPSHKVFMRLTVIMLDLVVFFWAARALTHRLTSAQKAGGSSRDWSAASSRMYAIVLLHPSLIIVDHGHFQYNSVCLGLAAAGAAAITNGQYRGAFLGSFLFCMSLNFKQMALYYSPAFFFWLLAWSLWCCRTAVGGRSETPLCAWFRGVVSRVLGLGVVVILSFTILWAPFCIYPGEESCLSSLKQVLLRLFPFSRGLFEDKVANIWFCLDVFFKLRRKVATPYLAKLALIATLSMLVPVAVELLRPRRALTVRRLLLAMFNSSMAFFLCSFQVHEKSILLPLCPLAFLWADSPLFVTWLQVLGVFSMLPLLGREGLLVPSVVCTMVYVVASMVLVSTNRGPRSECTAFPYGRYVTKGRFRGFVASSVVGMVLLLALEAAFLPPDTLPHLYPVLNALFSGGNLTVAYVLGVYWQWQHRVDKHEKIQ